MLSAPPVKKRSESRPEGIREEIGHAGVSRRQKCLQDFDGETDRKSQGDCSRHRPIVCAHRRKIRTEKESEGNESSNIYADVLPVVPVLPKFIPGSLEKLFVQDEETFWDEEVSR
jgi:hypothetical protein